MSNLENFIEMQKSFFRWAWSPLKALFQPILVSGFYGVLLYSFGYALGYVPEVEVILNNGFYVLGIDAQFKFAELFGTVGFILSLCSSVVISSISTSMPPIQQSSRATSTGNILQEEVWIPKRNIEDLDGNLELVSLVQEKMLYKSGINDIIQLSRADMNEIANSIRVSPSLAKMIIDEASLTIEEWRSQGLL